MLAGPIILTTKSGVSHQDCLATALGKENVSTMQYLPGGARVFPHLSMRDQRKWDKGDRSVHGLATVSHASERDHGA